MEKYAVEEKFDKINKEASEAVNTSLGICPICDSPLEINEKGFKYCPSCGTKPFED